MSRTPSLVRCLPWIALATLLVSPQSRLRELDASAVVANVVHRPGMPLVTPRPAVVTVPSKTAIDTANLQRQAVSENILKEHPAELPLPAFPLTQKPRSWILPDSAWKGIVQFPLKFDCGMDRGQPYVGLRLVIPLGS